MRKVVSMLLSITILCVFSTHVFATEDIPVQNGTGYLYENVDGDLSIEEGARPFIPNKNIPSMNYNNNQAELFSTNGFKKKLKMPHFRQENGYYCGPATVQQTISYVAKVTVSQKVLAKELGTTKDGTDMMNIAKVVNKRISGTGKSYTMRQIPDSQSDYAVNVYNALCAGKPVIIDIKATKSDGWKYRTNGHFLNISGVICNDSVNSIIVTDPNSKDKTNTYDLSVVYKVNNKHFRRSYIW